MVPIYTRRKERLVLVLILTLAICPLTNSEEEIAKCLGDQAVKRNLHSQLNITLEMSSRITHQLSTYIFRILLKEKLGYHPVKIITMDEFDVDNITNRMSCLKEEKGKLVDRIPDTMINLEVPVRLEFSLPPDSCVHEMGTIFPPGYFGWFIPKKLSPTIQEFISSQLEITDVHWTLFQNPKFVKQFDMTGHHKSIIDEAIQNDPKTNCPDSICANGWYLPNRCKRESCAVLLAPDFESSRQIITHIQETQVLIKVAWLGSKLKKITDFLITDYTNGNKQKTFLIFSWTPSDVIFDIQDFISVSMPRCDQDIQSVGCFYEKRRAVKYAWKTLEEETQIYDLLKNMNFLDNEYPPFLEMYNNEKNKKSPSEIACEWVNNNKEIWEQWIPKPNKYINIGGIFPISGSAYTGRGIVRGASMAKDAVNRQNILKGYQLNLLVADGQCRADRVMKSFIDYLTKSEPQYLVGVLGPACSDTVEPLAAISKYYKTITISYSAEGALFSNKDKYPYFFRTIGENKHYEYVYVELLKQLGWTRVAALTEDGQKYTEYISHMQIMLEDHNITFLSNTKFPRGKEKENNNMTPYLKDLKAKSARIIIADVFDDIARNVMCEAYKQKMTAEYGYVWFLPTWLNKTWYDTTYFNQHINESVNCTTKEMIQAINGYFSMTHAFYGEDDQIMQEKITVGQWREKYYNESQNITSDYAGYAYDAVWTYAYALEKLMKEEPEAIDNLHSLNVTLKLVNIIKSLDFNGVSGKIKFRGGATRFSVINIIQWYNNQTKVVGRFYPNIADDKPEIKGGNLILNQSLIRWKDGKIPSDGTPPPPECTLDSLAKFLNVKCEVAVIVLNIFIICILIITLTTVILIIKNRYDRKVKSTKNYMKSLGLEHLLIQSDQVGLDKWEIERDHVVLNRKLGEGAFGTVYGGEADLPDFGWTPVAVKTLKVGATTEEKLDFLSEAEVMKRFDHKNIVKLLGVCTKMEPVYTVMEFMLYGDLKTYLLARRHLVHSNNSDESEEVSSKKLTAMALDVARGLSYLAELKYVHRDVASRNCLLNGQRVVKLGDFGMTRPTLDNDYYKFNRKGMLPVRWMAPESLALGVFAPSSDVWSYGVLLYEIITFGSFPFQGLSNSQVLEYVKTGNHVTVPHGVKPPLEFLLKTCWSVDPKMRPSASEIVEHLANNSRLISPCLDVPLASVQMEDTAQLEMQLPDQFRKCSSSLSFKNLPILTAISSMSVHTPVKRQTSLQADTGVSIPMENCSPKEPLLPARSEIESGCSKYVSIKRMNEDSGCGQDENESYVSNTILNGHAISKV